MLVHEVLIFMSFCMLVCRSDDTLDILLFLISSMNFSTCLEIGKGSLNISLELEIRKGILQSKYFYSFLEGVHN